MRGSQVFWRYPGGVLEVSRRCLGGSERGRARRGCKKGGRKGGGEREGERDLQVRER